MSAETTNHPRRRWLALPALGYTAFVVYGSLVPLKMQPMPLAEAWRRFSDIGYLRLGIDSRADWVANLLLFVPLAFLWLALLWPQAGAWRRLLATAAVATASAALAVAIEFTQIFFPQRTVSINDMVAETIGAAVGIALWWTAGPRLLAWARGWSRARRLDEGWGRLLVLYLAGVLLYAVMPLDLTISPVEVYRKWKQGKVILVPFSAPYAGLAERFYDLASDAVIWAVAAALWRRASSRPPSVIWRQVVAAAAVVEAMQLFVYSRVSDPTDVIMAAVGAAIVLAPGWGRRAGAPAPARPRAGAIAAAALAWLGVVATVFWFPFDFRADPAFLAERLQGLGRVPFEAYYFGSEFRALTEVLHKSLFMLPLGVFLALLLPRPPGGRGAGVHLAAALLLALPAALVECGQLLLPSKNADLTDFALEWAGAMGGYACACWLQRLASGADRGTPIARAHRP